MGEFRDALEERGPATLGDRHPSRGYGGALRQAHARDKHRVAPQGHADRAREEMGHEAEPVPPGDAPEAEGMELKQVVFNHTPTPHAKVRAEGEPRSTHRRWDAVSAVCVLRGSARSLLSGRPRSD